MSKFIQTHFFYPSIFPLPIKKKGEKLNSFLFSYFSILPPFSILSLFHSSNQTNPKLQPTPLLSLLNDEVLPLSLSISSLLLLTMTKIMIRPLKKKKKNYCMVQFIIMKLKFGFEVWLLWVAFGGIVVFGLLFFRFNSIHL